MLPQQFVHPDAPHVLTTNLHVCVKAVYPVFAFAVRTMAPEYTIGAIPKQLQSMGAAGILPMMTPTYLPSYRAMVALMQNLIKYPPPLLHLYGAKLYDLYRRACEENQSLIFRVTGFPSHISLTSQQILDLNEDYHRRKIIFDQATFNPFHSRTHLIVGKRKNLNKIKHHRASPKQNSQQNDLIQQALQVIAASQQ